MSSYATPPLSTVHHPSQELGRLAALAMLELLAGKKPKIDMPAPSLIARESSARQLDRSKA
ncbi:MAG: substrate-binding domain-containing protein, partial [Burkholderiaceae bacterium]